ncbi:hypothetical protein Pst134EA_021184 [Puccinia striiformis f. sp. tritici]|uniref:hypothetical protein n=1 Tax=Puccinia striiformis f. sp. tritici TaxID=168172 RepID=UPI0020074F08|nr:hypothetical protein Pst134EA_021184 [Puccinia striiformis f. sp. tritici]KAH9457302.1 hypothetical protein Pst134EA_021184 [Puccinia striiformis f. sp. tritici]
MQGGRTTDDLRALTVKPDCGQGTRENLISSWEYHWPRPQRTPASFLLRSKIINSWDRNQDKVILLKDSLDVLNPSKRELQEQLNWLEKQRIGMYTDQLPMIRKILNETSDGITYVVYHRLMELGNAPIYDGLPVEMREMFTQHYSMSVFEGTKKLFTDYKTPFKDEGLMNEKLIVFHPKSSQKRPFQRTARFNVFVVSDYAFKVLDFLFENELINQEMIRAIFQDEKTLREFVVYVARKHANEAIPSFYQHMHNLTEHWFWKYMDKFTSALGTKEKLYINFVYLVEIVKSGDKGFYNSVSIQSDLESFDQSFVCRKYFSKFTSEHFETDHSKFPVVKNNQKETTLSLSVEEEMTKIINCLITENPYLRLDRRIGPYQLFDLVVGIVNLFQFMEKELFPGIIDELIHLCNETVLNSSAGSRHQNEVIHQDTTEKMNDLTTQYKARYREVLSSEHVSSLRHEFQMLSDKT